MLDLITKSGRGFLLYTSIAVFMILGLLAGIGAYDIQKSKETLRQAQGINNKVVPRQIMTDALGFDPFPSSGLALAVFPDEKNINSGNNATLELAKKLSNEILAKNPNGPLSKGGAPKVNVPQAEEIVNEFLQKGLKDFDYGSLKPKIADKNIKIISGSGPDDIKNYKNNFFAILNKSFGSKEDAARNTNDVAGSASVMVEIYSDYIKSFYDLSVPKDLAVLHKQELSLLIASKNIFEMLRDFEGDPLKASIALNAFQNIKTEMAGVYAELVRRR